MSLTDDLTWVKTHLLLLAIVGVLTFGGVFGTLSVIEKHDARVAIQYQTIADQQANQNKTLQALIVSEQAQLEADKTALTLQEAKIETLLSQRQVVEKQVPVTNATLDATQTALGIVKAVGGNATPSGSSVLLDLPTAQAVLTDVQLLPLVQADKVDLGNQLSDEKRIALDTQSQLSNEQKSHKSDVDTLNSQIAADGKQITKLKADIRKGRLKWFGIGFVSGFVTRVVLVP
jgi:hypothetical protein